MFIVAERRQRRFARRLFLLGCLMPTLIVAAWSVYRRVSNPGERYAASIAAAAGVRARIERVWYPRPGTTMLEHVTCVDPVTGSTIASAHGVRITRAESGLSVELIDPLVNIGPSESLAELLVRFVDTAALARQRLHVHAATLEVRWTDQTHGASADRQRLEPSMTLVQPSLSPIDSQQAQLECELPGAASAPDADGSGRPTRVRVTCRRAGQDGQRAALPGRSGTSPEPRVELVLDTRDNSLPVQLIATRLATDLGPAARFTGQIAWLRDTAGVTVDVRGRFDRWAVERTTLAQLLHGLWGDGQLTFDQCHVQQGRLIAARGRLTITGAESTDRFASLLAAFWNAPIGPATPPPEGGVVNLRFAIDAQRVKLRVDEPSQLVLRDRSASALELVGSVDRSLDDWMRLTRTSAADESPVTTANRLR